MRTTNDEETPTVLTVGASPTMRERMWHARDRDRGFRLLEADDQMEAISILGDVAPAVLIVNLAMRSGSPIGVADYASYRRPGIRILYEMGEGIRGFEDGSIFTHCVNAHGCVTPSMRAGDMAAVVAHHAFAQAA